MKLDGIDIDGTLKELESTLASEKELSPALKSMIGILILIVKLLTNRMGLNSSNSSKPPSSDQNRLKAVKRNQVENLEVRKAIVEKHSNKLKSLMKLR